MTYKELNQLFWIRKDIAAIKMDLAEIVYLSAAPLNDMPHSNTKSEPEDRILQKKTKIINRLKIKLNEYLDTKEKIEQYVEDIEDIKIRTIARRRFILCDEWKDIAREVHYTRERCYQLLINYINNSIEK